MADSHGNLAVLKAFIGRAKEGQPEAIEFLRSAIHGVTKPGKEIPVPDKVLIEMSEIMAADLSQWIRDHEAKN